MSLTACLSAPRPARQKVRWRACSFRHSSLRPPGGANVTCTTPRISPERFGRRVRNLISEHSAVLRLELSDDSQAAGRWSLKSGGSLFAVGASGALAGYRADYIAIDDAYRRSMEDAYSDSIRQKISDWFYGEVLPRARAGAALSDRYRYHHADLFAELEASGRYKVIKLSAIAEEGDDFGRAPGVFLWDDQPRHLSIC